MDLKSTLDEALRQLRLEQVKIQKQIGTINKLLKSFSQADVPHF